MKTNAPVASVSAIVALLTSEHVLGNDLSAVPIAVEDGRTFVIQHPQRFAEKFHWPPDLSRFEKR